MTICSLIFMLGVIALIIDFFVLRKIYKEKEKLKEMELKINEKDNKKS